MYLARQQVLNLIAGFVRMVAVLKKSRAWSHLKCRFVGKGATFLKAVNARSRDAT